jgi:hypothetical protein
MKIHKASKALVNVRIAKSSAQYFWILQEQTLTKWLHYANTVKTVLKGAWIQRNRVFSRKVFQSRGSSN